MIRLFLESRLWGEGPLGLTLQSKKYEDVSNECEAASVETGNEPGLAVFGVLERGEPDPGAANGDNYRSDEQ